MIAVEAGLETPAMQNLRDKLLKAGLVTGEQAQKAEAEQRRPTRETPPPRENRPRPNPGKESEARVPKLPPLPGSKAHQRLEAHKQRELAETLLGLVLRAEVPLEPGARTFHFVTRKGKLRRLELSEAQAALLEGGKLAVVERQQPDRIEHSLVPPETAEKMAELFPKSVRFFNRSEQPIGFLSDEELKTLPADDEEGSAGEGTWIRIKRA